MRRPHFFCPSLLTLTGQYKIESWVQSVLSTSLRYCRAWEASLDKTGYEACRQPADSLLLSFVTPPGCCVSPQAGPGEGEQAAEPQLLCVAHAAGGAQRAQGPGREAAQAARAGRRQGAGHQAGPAAEAGNGASIPTWHSRAKAWQPVIEGCRAPALPPVEDAEPPK